MDIFTLSLLRRWVSAERSTLFFVKVTTSRGRLPMEQPCSISICRLFSWGTTRYIVIPWNYIPTFPQKLLVSQNLDYCSRKLTHFLKYPSMRVKIIPSSLKFTSLRPENKAFNLSSNSLENSLSISIQYQSKGMKQKKLTSSRQTSSFERSKNHLRRSRCIHLIMATLHAKTAKNCRIDSWENCIILLW